MEQLNAVITWLIKEEHEIEVYLKNDAKVDVLAVAPHIVAWALIWGFLMRMSPNPYVCSSIHAIILTVVGAANIVLGHNEYEHYAFDFMTGYFIADFFTYCFKPEFYIYGFHHLLTVGASYRMINGRNWNETLFCSSCWLVELSTPFLNYYKVYQTPNGAILFAISFFVLRVLWLSYLSWYGFQVAINRLELAIITIFTLLNYYWFYEIVDKGRNQEKIAKKTE